MAVRTDIFVHPIHCAQLIHFDSTNRYARLRKWFMNISCHTRIDSIHSAISLEPTKAWLRKHDHNWLRQCFAFICKVLNHFMNQCWMFASVILGSKSQYEFDAFDISTCKLAVILFVSQCVKFLPLQYRSWHTKQLLTGQRPRDSIAFK